MYKLSTNCISVKGYSRSILYNLSLQTYDYIPNSLCGLLQNNSLITDWINLEQKKDDLDTISEYVNFLVENKYVINCNSKNEKCFIPLEWKGDTPENITSVTLNFNDIISNVFIHQIIDFIYKIEAKNIAILYTGKECCLIKLLQLLKGTYITNIELFLLNEEFANTVLESLIEENPSVTKIVFHTADEETLLFLDTKNQFPVYYTKNKIFDTFPESIKFIINKNFFFEAQLYNPYFYKKIFIDKNGNIKQSFYSDIICNVVNVDIDLLFENKELNKYWLITKDKINICKDCENKYACYDNRLPQLYSNEIWFYASTCGYNPYICKWQGQEGYVPIEECGTYSKETGFVPDEVKIVELNKQIWQEN